MTPWSFSILASRRLPSGRRINFAFCGNLLASTQFEADGKALAIGNAAMPARSGWFDLDIKTWGHEAATLEPGEAREVVLDL